MPPPAQRRPRSSWAGAAAQCCRQEWRGGEHEASKRMDDRARSTRGWTLHALHQHGMGLDTQTSRIPALTEALRPLAAPWAGRSRRVVQRRSPGDREAARHWAPGACEVGGPLSCTVPAGIMLPVTPAPPHDPLPLLTSSPAFSSARKAAASASVAPEVTSVSLCQSTGMPACRPLCAATACRQ